MAGPLDELITGNLPTSPEGMALRQRIALQMMGSSKKGYPKNLGEGLTAIGDSIGELGMSRRLEAQMAALERASAAAGGGAAALPRPLPAAPSSNAPYPGGGQQSAAPAPVQTAAVPDWLSGAQVSLPPPQATADASPQLPPAPAPVQDASVVPPVDQMSYPQTASLASPDTASDAPDPGIQPAAAAPPDPAIRAQIAQTLQARQGVPQQNPMLAGQAPAGLPSTFSPADLGSPPEAADNRPIVAPNIQVAQVGGTGVKPPGTAAEPVPDAPMVARPKLPPQLQPPPQFGPPPRIAPPSDAQLRYERLATDPNILQSYRDKYKEQALELERQRKEDHDQAIKAYDTRNDLVKDQYIKSQDALRSSDTLEYARRKSADEEQQRARTEKISRAFGPSGIAPVEKGIEDSYKNVAGLAQQNKAINDIRNTLVNDRMFTGSAAELQNTRAKVLHAFGFRLDPRVVDTERFATLMAPIVAANRRMISGNQNISDKDVEAALKASGGDPKLEKESLLTILGDLQEGSLATAVEHQRKIRDITGAVGEKDYEARMYNQRGVPNFHQLVPQAAVDELLAHPDTAAEFDDTFHTPGLSQQIMRFRQRSR